MRKYLLYLLVTLIALPAISQNSDRKLRLGIGASPSLSWLASDYENVENDGVKTGIKFGINVDYRILDNYFFSTGISLSTQNGKLKYNDENLPFIINGVVDTFNIEGPDKNVAVDYQLKYIEIPFGLKLKTNEIGYFTYLAKFGLNPMFNISALGSTDQSSYNDVEINDEVNFFNLGYHIGGGLEYALSGNFILAGGITYNQGFFDVTSNTDGRVEDKTMLSNISLELGIFF